MDEGLTAEQQASVREWEGTILHVEVEEMGHFGAVRNLFSAIGGRVYRLTSGRNKMPRSWIVAAAGAIALMTASSAASADNDRHRDRGVLAALAAEAQRIKVGRAIAPVPLDLAGKDRHESAEVLLGSYIVNSQGGCNDCHTNPPYAAGGDPFLGEPEQINVEGYLCGGVPFGQELLSTDISPDADGLPAGLERSAFIALMQTGEKPSGGLSQVMPWPVYGKMIRPDVSAIYAYLSAIPSCSAAP
jgi:Ferritin-like